VKAAFGNFELALKVILKSEQPRVISSVLIGQKEWEVITHNDQPCDPPDLSDDHKTFCGLPVRRIEGSALAFTIEIPRL
jgi:hypothetical protein